MVHILKTSLLINMKYDFTQSEGEFFTNLSLKAIIINLNRIVLIYSTSYHSSYTALLNVIWKLTSFHITVPGPFTESHFLE